MRAACVIALAASAGVAGFVAGRHSMAAPAPEVRIDTVEVMLPSARAEVELPMRDFRLPKICIANFSGERSVEGGESAAEDSADVRLPIVARQYAGAEYEAWVSGPLDPRLDSLRIISGTMTVAPVSAAKPKRWHLGLSAGVAATPNGLQPYAGVSVTYSLKSF